MLAIPDGTWLTRSHITGPTYLKLSVAVSATPIKNPSVEASQQLLNGNSLAAEDVAAAVLRGAGKANLQYRTQLHPLAIKYASDGLSPLTRLEYVTFKMIEAAAIPGFAGNLQAAINDRNVSFQKLSDATGISKSILSSVAEMGNLAGIEQDVIVNLSKYFKLVDETE